MANKNYILLKKWVEHSGITYEAGSKIGLSESQAKSFAENGYIELESNPKKKKQTKKSVKKEINELNDSFIAAEN